MCRLARVTIQRGECDPVPRSGDGCMLQALVHHRFHLGLDLGILPGDKVIAEDAGSETIPHVFPVLFALEHLTQNCGTGIGMFPEIIIAYYPGDLFRGGIFRCQVAGNYPAGADRGINDGE